MGSKARMFLFDKIYGDDGKTVTGYAFFDTDGVVRVYSLRLTADYISGFFPNKPVIEGLPWDDFVEDMGIMHEVIAVKGKLCKLKPISGGTISTLSLSDAANYYRRGLMEFKNAKVVYSATKGYSLYITDKSVLRPFDEVEN